MTTSAELTSREADPISRNHRLLNETCRQRVHGIVEQRGITCHSCGASAFDIGDGLEMGSIWPNEELGSYMIALNCSHCGARSGIRLHESQFLTG